MSDFFRSQFYAQFGSAFRVNKRGQPELTALDDVQYLEIVAYNYDQMLRGIDSRIAKDRRRAQEVRNSVRKKRRQREASTLQQAVDHGMRTWGYGQPSALMLVREVQRGNAELLIHTEVAFGNSEFFPLTVTIRQGVNSPVPRSYIPLIDDLQLDGHNVEYQDLFGTGEDQYCINTMTLDSPQTRGKMLWLILATLSEKVCVRLWPLVFEDTPPAVPGG